jgi:hypothetical protein
MPELKFILQLLKEAGLPTALAIYMIVGGFFYLKYLEAKYGIKPFWKKSTPATDTAGQAINIYTDGQGNQHPEQRHTQYVTSGYCRERRKETDEKLDEMQKSLSEIKGSTAVIEKIVTNKFGGT